MIPSIKDLESAALCLASDACSFAPYYEVYKGTETEKVLVAEAQSLNRVAQYLFERAKERRSAIKDDILEKAQETAAELKSYPTREE